MWCWVELFRLRDASFGIAASVFRIGPDLQCRFLFIVLLEVTNTADMFEVSHGVILLIFGRKKMDIRCLNSFVYKCIRYKNLRRAKNIGVACKSQRCWAWSHSSLARRDFQLRGFLTRGVRTIVWKVLCFPVVPLNLSSSYLNPCNLLQPVSHLKIFIVALGAVFDVL